MRNWSLGRGVVLALTLALGAAGLAAAAPATVNATQASCGTFSGPGWTRVDQMTGESQAGTTWRVSTRGAVPCTYAKSTAKVLVKTPFKGEALTKLKSPRGWVCVAGGGYSGGGKGTSGSCNQGARKWFGWGPATPA